MPQLHRLIDRRLAKILLILQAAMIPVATLLAWLVRDVLAAKSAFLGALIYCLASYYFAWCAFRYSGARASKQILGSMYLGLIGKLLIVVVGLMVILKLCSPLNMMAVIFGFILVQVVSWIAPFIATKPA